MDPSILRRSIKGEVLERSTAAYEAALSGLLWNQLRAERRPDLIVRVHDEQDVVEAIKFAATNDLRVVARGGGHSWCGLAVREGGMVIDLEGLNDVTLDVDARRARIQPFISNRDVIRHLEPHGLAFPVGHCPTVKASGFLLGGGIGWNANHWGQACYSVEALDVVTAQGELVRCDSNSNTDLYWAARGGGAGFPGIAVGYHLRLYTMPKAMSFSAYYYQLEHIRDVGDWFWKVADELPPWVELSVFLVTAPPELRSQCASTNGKVCLVTAEAFADDAADATAALAMLEDFPLRNTCMSATVNQPTSFNDLFDASGAMWPEPMRSRVETFWSKTSLAEILPAAAQHFVSCPSPETVMLVALYPAWANGVPGNPDTAFSLSAKAYVGLWTMWRQPAEDAANNQWHDTMMSVYRPFTIGHYLGETDIVEDRGRPQACYGSTNWERLQKLRKELDPKGIFQGFEGGL